jgi:dual specificity phosphatase 12
MIIDYFDECIDFIEEGRREGAVFVHCAAGVSRSATIVIAYVMKKHQWDYETAFDFVQKRRPIVYPNEGFIKQLKVYHILNYRLDKSAPVYLELQKELESSRKQRQDVLTNLGVELLE